MQSVLWGCDFVVWTRSTSRRTKTKTPDALRKGHVLRTLAEGIRETYDAFRALIETSRIGFTA